MKGTLHEDEYIFSITTRSILVRMKNISDKIYRDDRDTHLMFRNFFENITTYEIMWKNIVEPGRPQITVWCMRISFWIPTARNIHTCFEIFIVFPLQQWLQPAPPYYVICTLSVLLIVKQVAILAPLGSKQTISNVCALDSSRGILRNQIGTVGNATTLYPTRPMIRVPTADSSSLL